jgi:uncharacterized protein (TIGR04255 family)
VWQLRFEDHPTLAAAQTVLRFQELLGGPEQFALTLLPKLQLSVQASGLDAENVYAPAQGAAGGGWRLSAVEGSWQVSADSASLAIETTRYGTWEKDFLPRLQQVLDALTDVGTPVIESRLGLRYINVLTGSAVGKPPLSAPDELSGLVAPWLLGPLNEPRVQNLVEVSQGHTVLSFERAKTILNYGVVAAETRELGYLIDIDAFREGGRALRIDEVMAQTEILHATALGLFQLSLTPEALEAMRSSSTGAAGG